VSFFIPKALAARVDRASRYAHRFHRFAHHPLCNRYRSELISVGHRARLCRGCAFGAFGGALGFALGICLHLRAPLGIVIALTASGWLLITSVVRFPKVGSRLIPAALLGAAASGGIAMALAIGAVIAAMLWAYRQRGPDRSPCFACLERHLSVCSGYAPIVRRERAFRRLSARWIKRSPLIRW
jgi:hypothetical protein